MQNEEKAPAVVRGGRRFFRQAKSCFFRKKSLTIRRLYYIIVEAVRVIAEAEDEYAAIAQSVERILGKDEVASSNLASSSKASGTFGFQRFSFAFGAFT